MSRRQRSYRATAVADVRVPDRNASPPLASLERLSTPDRVVLEPLLLHRRRVVEIAAVEDHRGLERLLQIVEVRAAELLPLRDDDERIGAIERFTPSPHEREIRAITPDAFRFLARRRIERPHLRARGPERLDEHAARRFA